MDQQCASSAPSRQADDATPMPPKMQLLAQHSASTATPAPPTKPPAFYSSAQWTADGTTIVTGSSDNTVSSFVLPTDLLQPRSDGPRALEPQSSITLPEPTQVIAPAPFFSLSEPASQTLLVGCREHPLHLYHAFPDSSQPAPISQYRLIRHETEQYIAPASLVWQHPGTHFICGSANRLDYFDVSRHGSDGPVLTVPTIPSKRHICKGHGIGMKGVVSALGLSPPDAGSSQLVAAGTRTRWMGLYDLHRSEGAVANWKISQSDLPGSPERCAGQGIVQVLWSPCGRYLVINERHSDGLLVYDIRGSGRLLSVLSGRTAESQQKLNCDVFHAGDPYADGGFEVWAGCQGGSVLVWDKVGLTAGETESSWQWQPHDSPVSATILHPSGSVVATCSGGWVHSATDRDDENHGVAYAAHEQQGCRVLDESSLKLWSVSEPEND